jgi:predicted small metal-binding protein
VWTRWCRACARLVRVCDYHGAGDGLAAASNAIADHIRETHDNPKTSRRAAANGA